MDKSELQEEIERVKSENSEYIHQLEEENKMYLEKILKNAKYISESPDVTKSFEAKECRSYSPFRPRSTTPQPTFHDLTLKQVKEAIEELYNAKSKYDIKCNETMQAKESFENFMHNYISQKYGLKSLYHQWMNLFSKALSRFENDIDVKIFKKIKDNTISEEFMLEVKQLKDRINDSIRAYIRAKNQYMREVNIKTLQEEINEADIEEEMLDFVITSMPGKEKLIKDEIEQLYSPLKSSKKKRTMNFREFLRIAMEICLSDHEMLKSKASPSKLNSSIH